MKIQIIQDWGRDFIAFEGLLLAEFHSFFFLRIILVLLSIRDCRSFEHA